MAKSTYYYEISKEDAVGKRNEDLLKLIKAIFKQHKQRYGVRRVYQELVNQGYEVNHKRVQRLMHESGLSGIKPKEKYHSYKGTVGKTAENIISRDFKADKPLKNRQQMSRSLIFLGADATFHLFSIWQQMKSFHTTNR